MNNRPLISVIIPVYKVEKYLRGCVESIISQTYTNWELILVDDGSPDNSGLICDEYADKDPRIQVIHKENGGQAQARNRGIDACKGEYVTFLDSDDFFHHGYLLYMVDVALRYDADIVQCDFIRGEDVVFPPQGIKVKEEVFGNHSIFLQGKAKIIVWGKVYKRELLIENRIKEGKYYEDDFTTWKWYYHAKKIIVTNKILYYYTNNPTSTMALHQKKPSFDFIEAYDERISFFINTKERDLEDSSRLQFGKALVLTYSNRMLDSEERKQIKIKFDENWEYLKDSKFIPYFYKRLFGLFSYFPLLTSLTANRLHN